MHFGYENFGWLALSLGRLPRTAKKTLMLLADGVVVPLALWLAIALRYGDASAPLTSNLWLYPLAIAIVLPIMMRFGLYRAVIRFVGARIVLSIVYTLIISLVLLGAVVNLTTDVTLPFSVLVIFGAFAIIGLGGTRFTVRAMLQSHGARGDRVAIYGAGSAGADLASSLLTNQSLAPVAFLDDSRALHGSVINGIEVFAPSKLPELIETLGISRVLLAVPAASMGRRRKVIEQLETMPVHVQTMPSMEDLVSGATRVDEIRDVDVADLLGRDSVPPNKSLLGACVKEKVVMVTGAGGSIGSELCRQISALSPRKLLLFESSELALYNINQQLALIKDRDALDFELVPMLGSAVDKHHVLKVMRKYKVQTVYHAAAYKHVPLVEQNIVTGVRNNVFGTFHCAAAAIEANVETFVLISTDKAVCPTNVMGASKRLAEMVLQGLDERGTSTCFCMVRFGNVLASSGSVVPLFREQIRRGGPVTVTHPEIIRYFMTIPEAAQLVIQAGSMGTGGDVFLLDMGKPVRIADLARRMIQLMGLSILDEENPDGDIEIKFTGLRPAEKLYEELLIGNSVMGTEHSMIMRAEEKLMPWSEVSTVLKKVEETFESVDSQAVLRLLSEAVDEYTPSAQAVDLLRPWDGEEEQHRTSKVASLATKSVR